MYLKLQTINLELIYLKLIKSMKKSFLLLVIIGFLISGCNSNQKKIIGHWSDVSHFETVWAFYDDGGGDVKIYYPDMINFGYISYFKWEINKDILIIERKYLGVYQPKEYFNISVLSEDSLIIHEEDTTSKRKDTIFKKIPDKFFNKVDRKK